MVELKPPLSTESAPPMFVTASVETPPVVVEDVQPVPVAESVPVRQVQIVEKTIEFPQWQTAQKIVEFREIQTVLGTRTSQSFGTAHFEQSAPAELMEMVELEPPLPAKSAPPMFVPAPAVEVENVQPAHVIEYVAPAPAVTYAAPALVDEYIAPEPFPHEKFDELVKILASKQAELPQAKLVVQRL